MIEHELINTLQHKVVSLFETSIQYRTNHFHFEQEMFLVLSGDITVIVSGELYNLHKGDFMLFGKSQPHMLRADTSNVLLVAQFNLDLLNFSFPQMEAFQKMSLILPCNHQSLLWKSVEQQFLRIAAYQVQNSPYIHLVSLNALLTVILTLLRYSDSTSGSVPDSSISDLVGSRQKRILHWITEHYRQNITLQQLASLEGVNSCYLSHYIRDNMGFTFTQFVTEMRTTHAAHLLASTDMTILDILLDSGFSDYRYMRKAFQERFHCTPKEYRSASKVLKIPPTEGGNLLIYPDMPGFSAAITEYCPGFPEPFFTDKTPQNV